MNDLARTLFFHMRNDCFCHHDNGQQVLFVKRIPNTFYRAQRMGGWIICGFGTGTHVVDQYVDLAALRQRRFDYLNDSVGVGNIVD